jgi:glutathione synthase/RimK-type ligase-like ATP-grasp enzyme
MPWSTFTSHPIGDKVKVHQKIKEAKTFGHYLIPSIEVRKPHDVITFINKYKKIVIKPVKGHRGQNIFLYGEIKKTLLSNKTRQEFGFMK